MRYNLSSFKNLWHRCFPRAMIAGFWFLERTAARRSWRRSFQTPSMLVLHLYVCEEQIVSCVDFIFGHMSWTAYMAHHSGVNVWRPCLRLRQNALCDVSAIWLSCRLGSESGGEAQVSSSSKSCGGQHTDVHGWYTRIVERTAYERVDWGEQSPRIYDESTYELSRGTWTALFRLRYQRHSVSRARPANWRRATRGPRISKLCGVVLYVYTLTRWWKRWGRKIFWKVIRWSQRRRIMRRARNVGATNKFLNLP